MRDTFDDYDHCADAIINAGAAPWKSWLIWGTAALFYLYEYILRVSPSVMTNQLMQDFGVTSAALGVLASFYYYAYTPLQIPCGVIVDRLGVRRVISLSALFCAMGSVIFSQSESLLWAQLGRMLMGAGSACAYLSTAKIAAEWFPPKKFAIITSTTMGIGLIGATFGGKPFAIVVNAYGWRDAMFMAAVVGAGVALAAWLIIRDRKETVATTQPTIVEAAVLQKQTLLSGLKVVASNPQSWLIGLYGCFMYLPLSAFAELWAVPYLMQLHGIDNEVASSASIMVFIGMAIGCPVSAWLSDKVESRLKVMGFSALATAFMFMFIVYCPIIPLNLTFGLLFVTGVLAGGQILYFAAAKEINPPQTSATTIAFTNTLVMVSAIIFQPLLGYLLDWNWEGLRTEAGIPMYSIEAYQIALSPVPIFLLVSWFILRFVRETYPK
ncbi:MAG: MFS transporter [Alphaproteobacteria bacterium]|nr:MFS transporter [Alphaproteobacteria bacterium]